MPQKRTLKNNNKRKTEPRTENLWHVAVIIKGGGVRLTFADLRMPLYLLVILIASDMGVGEQ